MDQAQIMPTLSNHLPTNPCFAYLVYYLPSVLLFAYYVQLFVYPIQPFAYPVSYFAYFVNHLSTQSHILSTRSHFLPIHIVTIDHLDLSCPAKTPVLCPIFHSMPWKSPKRLFQAG